MTTNRYPVLPPYNLICSDRSGRLSKGISSRLHRSISTLMIRNPSGRFVIYIIKKPNIGWSWKLSNAVSTRSIRIFPSFRLTIPPTPVRFTKPNFRNIMRRRSNLSIRSTRSCRRSHSTPIIPKHQLKTQNTVSVDLFQHHYMISTHRFLIMLRS